MLNNSVKAWNKRSDLEWNVVSYWLSWMGQLSGLSGSKKATASAPELDPTLNPVTKGSWDAITSKLATTAPSQPLQLPTLLDSIYLPKNLHLSSPTIQSPLWCVISRLPFKSGAYLDLKIFKLNLNDGSCVYLLSVLDTPDGSWVVL